MASLNKAMIIGNLGVKPELRYTSNSTPVTTLRIATHERFTRQSGEADERTEWHSVVVFGRTAENCCEYLDKGRQVYVEGRIQTRKWEDRDGNERYSTEIVANQVTFLSGGNDGNFGGGGGGGQRSSGGGGGGGGYNQSYSGGNSGGGGGGGQRSGGGGFEPAFDDDDIPF